MPQTTIFQLDWGTPEYLEDVRCLGEEGGGGMYKSGFTFGSRLKVVKTLKEHLHEG